MTTKATIHTLTPAAPDPERAHRMRLAGAWAIAVALVLAIAAYGFDYYTLGTEDRPFSPKHALLRPSGPIGIKLGMLGVGMFLMIYLYYFRKRWGWLASIGRTKHWLDFHIVLGVTAPDHHRLSRGVQIPRHRRDGLLDHGGRGVERHRGPLSLRPDSRGI